MSLKDFKIEGYKMDIYCLVFDDYETLDLMGPVEFLARVPNVKLHYVSQVED